MEDVEIETDEKSLFGVTKTKTVKQWTGNIVLSEKDYLKLRREINKGKKAEGKLESILKTDIYQQNKKLKNELENQINKNDKDIDDYNDLVRRYNKLGQENSSLKNQISDLKNELRITYNSVRDNFKERLGGLKASRSAFKSLVDVISSKMNNSLKVNLIKKIKKK